jgi:hypothetical protein
MAATVIARLEEWPPFVQNSVILCSLKYMLCDEKYAKLLAPKIFQVFEDTTNQSMEETVLSCFYDLLITHPNIITPWKNSIYNKLVCPRVATQVISIEIISKLLAKSHIKVISS